MNHTETASQVTGLPKEQIRNFTAISLVGDLLERGLKYPIDDLHQLLIQIADSGLLDSIEKLSNEIRELVVKADELQTRAWEFYPQSYRGGARHLIRRENVDLLQEVEICRQEHFWLNERKVSMADSEQLIGELFALYKDVEFFMRTVDSFGEAGECERKFSAPICPPNPYEDNVPNSRAA
jgi:hypothetical protein